MKNIKEIKPILSALYCINRTNKNEDKDITNILDYAFHRILDGNSNLLMLCCLGKDKKDIMPKIEQLLKEDTKYFDYLENKKR